MWLTFANSIKIEKIPRPDAGAFIGGPRKIVHHTTEGGFPGSLATLEQRHVESHFLVGADRIVQFIDTDRASKSLQNASGGVETNRDGAIQLELVGFAAQPKDPKVLANAAAICRQLESLHSIPRRWPNGYPTPYPLPPGVKQNRDAKTWDTVSGHYGHCHVPENSHGDPGYTRAEADLVVPPIIVVPPAPSPASSPVTDPPVIGQPDDPGAPAPDWESLFARFITWLAGLFKPKGN